MSEGQADPPPGSTAPDPMKGIRGVFAAVLILEAIVVLLALLVFARFGSGPPAVGVAVIVGLAVLMVVGSGLQRRSGGVGYALGGQTGPIVGGVGLGTPPGGVGLIFAVGRGGPPA